MILMAVVMPEETSNRVLMGFDYGEARIGVATGNTLLKIAHPLTTVTGEGMWNKIDQLEELIKKWQPQLLVVGIPSASDDPKKIQLINTINNFAKRLGRKFNLPVTLIAEDFSSADAAMLLEEQAIYGKSQKGKLDQLAACAILQTYFSEIR
jgi:putative Holliday junction resolvase